MFKQYELRYCTEASECGACWETKQFSTLQEAAQFASKQTYQNIYTVTDVLNGRVYYHRDVADLLG